MYKKSLIDILNAEVSALVFPVNCVKVGSALSPTSIIRKPPSVALGFNYVLNVDNCYHAQIGFMITIGSNQYEIVAVAYRVAPGMDQITVNDSTGSNPPVTGEFNMYTVFFEHGTPKETDTALAQERQAILKYPMIWLWEEFQETFDDDQESSTERVSDIQLCFLTQSDYSALKDDIATNFVEPMSRLWNAFLEQRINNPMSNYVRNDLKYKVIRKNKFNVYISGKGSDKQLFADNLSGVIIQVQLPLLKTQECPVYS